MKELNLKKYKKFINPVGDIVYSLKDDFRKKGTISPIALTIKKPYTFDNKKFPGYYSVTYFINNNITRRMQNKEFKSKNELIDFVQKLSRRGM